MKHEIAVGVMTAPKIEAVIPGPHSTPERPTFLLKNVRIGIVANRESFDRLTPTRLRDIIREVANNPCI